MRTNRSDVAYWLALLFTQKLGPITSSKLLEIFSSPAALFNASRQELLNHKISSNFVEQFQNPNWQAVEQALLWANQPGNHIITWQDSHYPELLRQIPAPPLVLFVRGNLSVLSKPQLAMVGSRHPTPWGLDIAYQFAQHLAGGDLVITSGLALGIDGASHKGALAAQGLTIGVLGTGLDHIYPARHKALAGQIIEQGGALVSEFSPGTLPKPEHFPRRNRIISGLSLGVLVVEAAIQSGSLITAKYALEQGREVFAIPGAIHNPLARGCHALLKQGAKLVETSNDILEEFPLYRGMQGQSGHKISKKNDQKAVFSAQDAKLIECMGFEATPIDTLIERSGLSADVVSSHLLVLELQGHVTAVPGGYLRNVI